MKDKKGSSNSNSKIDYSKIPLDEISDPIIRLEEKFRRERENLENQLKIEKENQEIRLKKIEKLESLVSSKEVLELFPNLLSSKDLVIEMISLLEMKEEIKSILNSKKDSKNKFIPESSHVFHFKLYKGSNPSLGDRKISGEILPRFGFPNLEDFSNPYPNSVKFRDGSYDSYLSEGHKSKLEELDLLGEIKDKSKLISNPNLFNELKEIS